MPIKTKKSKVDLYLYNAHMRVQGSCNENAGFQVGLHGAIILLRKRGWVRGRVWTAPEVGIVTRTPWLPLLVTPRRTLIRSYSTAQCSGPSGDPNKPIYLF